MVWSKSQSCTYVLHGKEWLSDASQLWINLFYGNYSSMVRQIMHIMYIQADTWRCCLRIMHQYLFTCRSSSTSASIRQWRSYPPPSLAALRTWSAFSSCFSSCSLRSRSSVTWCLEIRWMTSGLCSKLCKFLLICVIIIIFLVPEGNHSCITHKYLWCQRCITM